MRQATVSTPSAAIRWLAVLAAIVICAVMAIIGAGHTPSHPFALQTLALMAIAIAVCAWILSPATETILITAGVLGTFSWVLLRRPSLELLLDVGAFALLLVVAGLQRRHRLSRFRRLSQLLEDAAEERVVKEQAIALTMQIRDALQKKLQRYTQLQHIAEQLSNMTDLSAIAQLAVEQTFNLIGKSDVCLLFLVDREQQELSLFASKRSESVAPIRAKHGDQFDRYVLRTHRPLLVNDVRRDFRFTVNVSPDRPVSSVIACPLLVDQSPEGVLRLDSSQPAAYTQDDLRLLEILLDLLATAVTNARLFAQTQRLAMTDGLTSLTVRRPFLEGLSRELVRAARNREPVSLLMLDVDHFKEYNDSFGHMAGDVILRGVAEVLRVSVPPGGMAGRLGGDEFALLLPRLARHEAGELAEKIRALVEQRVQRQPSRGGGLRTSVDAAKRLSAVTVSVGVASFPDDAQADLELIRTADQRLYQAKRSGRNVVCSV